VSSIVYSTDKSWQQKCDICGEIMEFCMCKESADFEPALQTALIRREKKSRAGKTVTTISGIKGGEKSLQKEIQKKCASGGVLKNGVIEIQGDHREKVAQILKDKGYKIKFIGG